jgi:hypothetical protein
MKFSAIQIYYYLTPVFFIAEKITGLDIRISGILSETQSWIYFIFCLFCAAVCFFLPRWSVAVAFVESILNITILMASIYIGHVLSAGLDGHFEFGLPNLINFMVSGSVLLVAYYSAQSQLFKNV